MDAMGALVGEEIRAVLGRRRMSVSALARAIGETQTYVARRVDGRAAFTPAELRRVAEVLECSVADLLPAAAREVPPNAETVDFSDIDLNGLQKIAAALGVSVASLLPARESAASAGAGSGPPPRFRPENGDDDNGTNSTYFSPSTKRTPDDQRKDVTFRASRPAEATRPPSGPGARHGNRTVGPASRRPRVDARLAGGRP